MFLLYAAALKCVMAFFHCLSSLSATETLSRRQYRERLSVCYLPGRQAYSTGLEGPGVFLSIPEGIGGLGRPPSFPRARTLPRPPLCDMTLVSGHWP